MTDPDRVHDLERQVERGNLFAHTVLTEQAARANKTEALIHGLADLLIRNDVISAEDLLAAEEVGETTVGNHHAPLAIDGQQRFAEAIEQLEIGDALALQSINARGEVVALALELRQKIASSAEHDHSCGGS